jgi:hypothetical protein
MPRTQNRQQTPRTAVATQAQPPRVDHLAALATATLRIGAISSDLHGSPLVPESTQNAFWTLREHALRVSMRFDHAWERIISREPPTDQALQGLATLADGAVDALAQALKSPTETRLLSALSSASTSLDRTDAMFDMLAS